MKITKIVTLILGITSLAFAQGKNEFIRVNAPVVA